MFTKEQYTALFAAMRDSHMFAFMAAMQATDDPHATPDACVTSTLNKVIQILNNEELAARWMKTLNVNE